MVNLHSIVNLNALIFRGTPMFSMWIVHFWVWDYKAEKIANPNKAFLLGKMIAFSKQVTIKIRMISPFCRCILQSDSLIPILFSE
jgi:hypothetical protein